MTRPKVKVGLCGATISLADYPRHFSVLEVQQTFYQPPALATLRRWRATTPPGFEFTMKAWQLITHSGTTSSTYRRLRRPLTPAERADTGGFRATPIVDEGWATTVECAAVLAATSILFQCPASFRPTDENLSLMRAFFGRIRRPAGVRLLWEPRGPWPEDVVRSLCGDLDLVHVVDPFVTRPLTSAPTYLRLHGITGARHVYSDAELRTLLDMLPAGETYVLFNNMPRVGDAKRFIALLEETSDGRR
jgi:uncharacterized protein YecE (DUF72 family)